MTLEGILPVWKPRGFTSHDVVAKVRGIVKIKRIGHTGTLDPDVTGVLPLCIGRATRLVEYIQDLPKAYEVRLILGFSTDTEDLSGTVTEKLEDVKLRLTEERLRQAISRFVGEIDQVPPMYSAVKVDGKRLYELARQGVEIERKSRRVTIYGIEILESDWSGEYPAVRFRAECSKGTYIRTLCVDIGRTLGVPAVMGELVRVSTGNIGPESCLTLEQVADLHKSGQLQSHLLPMERAMSHLPSVRLNEEQARRALLGQKVPYAFGMEQDGTVAAFAEDGRLVGIFETDTERKLLVPVKVFS